MPKLKIVLALTLFFGYPMLANAEVPTIKSHANHLREVRQNLQQKKPQVAEKAPVITESEAPKRAAQPAVENKPVKKSEPKKEIKRIPERGMQTSPSRGVVPPQKHEETKKDKPEQKRAHHDKEPDKHHIKPQPDPHRSHHEPKHHKKKNKTVVKYYVTAPVQYVSTSNGAVVYEANPHIYTPNAYNCFYKDERKYCTDYKGKALTGRIVQNYEDSVAYENYRNGYLHGETSVYTLDGQLWQTTNYSKGVKNGKEIVYFENGRVNYTLNYSNGKIDGQVKQYDIHGTMLGDMRYSNGHYKYRYCRNDASDAALRARVKANMLNDLVLCVDN